MKITAYVVLGGVPWVTEKLGPCLAFADRLHPQDRARAELTPLVEAAPLTEVASALLQIVDLAELTGEKGIEKLARRALKTLED